MLKIDIAKILSNRVAQRAQELNTNELGLKEWSLKYIPHYFFRGMSIFHETLSDELDRIDQNRGTIECIQAPRGNAKSTWASLAKPLKSICKGTERFIIIISDNGPAAKKYLASIKSELEENELLRKDYPTACSAGAVWNNDQLVTGNDVCIIALGKGESVRGRKYKQYRPTLIIVDDPQSDEDVNSPTMRERDVEWVNRSLLPAGESRITNFFFVGNNLHQDSIMAKVSTRPDVKLIKFQSIMTWPTNMNLWDEWERLYQAGEKEMCDEYYKKYKDELELGATVLWEEKENLLELMQLRANIGHAAFEAEKQNNPRDPSKQEFPDEWFGPENEYTTLPLNIASVVVGYCDPAKGRESKRRDFTALIDLHFVPEHRCCYVECIISRIHLTKLTDTIVNLLRIRNYAAYGVESNGFQEMVGDEAEAKAQAAGIPFVISPIDNYAIHKSTRISRLSVWLQKGFFKFKKGCPHTKILLDQLKGHPNADHDDGPDGLEGALRVLTSVCNLRNANVVTVAEDDNLGDNIFGAIGYGDGFM